MENVNVSSEDIQSVIASDPTFGLKLRIAALERMLKEKDAMIASLTPNLGSMQNGASEPILEPVESEY